MSNREREMTPRWLEFQNANLEVLQIFDEMECYVWNLNK